MYDPSRLDTISIFRGGGRMIQILKENLSDQATFITDFAKVTEKDTLLIPCFNPFQRPLLSRRIAKKQIIMIFDVIPLVYPAHFPIGIKGKINLFLNKKALKQFDTILTISQKSKKDITTHLHIPSEKIKVIYPPPSIIFTNSKKPNPTHSTNFNQFQPTPILTHSNQCKPITHKYCIYVGDVNWNKNLVNLARAIKIANVSCVFVGKNFTTDFRLSPTAFRLISHPWQKEFKDFLIEIGDDPRFIFTGYKSDKDLIKLYIQAYLNILVSQDEGFGFSYLEASTLGVPSVLSDIPVFHETAENFALFANPNDPDDIASKIKHLFENEDERVKLSFKAQERSYSFNQKKFKNIIIDF